MLVLLDLHLPDLGGEEVLQRLRDDPATASIPVVIVSADATPGQIRRLLTAGAAGIPHQTHRCARPASHPRRGHVRIMNGLSRTVLHVEDDRQNLDLVAAILARRPDVDLVSAMDGNRGLELALDRRPAVILLDLHMQDMSGEDFLRRLRAEATTAAIPVIVVSGDTDREHVAAARSIGASAYLTKPYTIAELLNAIDAVLP